MSRYRNVYLTLFLSLQFAAAAAAQSFSNRTVGVFVPRHERLAASVLRRPIGDRIAASTKPAEQPVKTLKRAIQAPPAALEVSADELAPPAPPVVIQESEAGQAFEEFVFDAPGEVPLADGGWLGEPVDVPGYGPAVCDSTGCDGCSACRVRAPCWIDTFSLNLGVHGFKGGLNRGESGSFGIEQGTNWGSPSVFPPLGLNVQFGFRTTQNDGNGAAFTAASRQQYFVTGGFFRRAHQGWQGGVVFDYLHDDWYASLDLGQIRGELSWASLNGTSLGVWFATNVSEDTITFNNQQETYDTHDIVAAFYRMPSLNHPLGKWRLFAGFTGRSDGIIGTDFRIPLPGTWSFEPEFTYLIPDESASQQAHQHEAWNVGLNLVWYPGRAVNGVNMEKLPLLDVAGNGSMISRRR